MEGKYSEINKIAGRRDDSCFYSFYSYSEVHYFKVTKVDTKRNNNLKKKKKTQKKISDKQWKKEENIKGKKNSGKRNQRKSM